MAIDRLGWQLSALAWQLSALAWQLSTLGWQLSAFALNWRVAIARVAIARVAIARVAIARVAINLDSNFTAPKTVQIVFVSRLSLKLSLNK